MSSNEEGNTPAGGFQQNPDSRWQEPSREDDLTIWEVQRKPRKVDEAANKYRRICVPLKMLNAELRCVICLGYIKHATAVMVCLHRFCGDCIHKCIRVGMKECPSCRKPIPSRRSLRYDAKFDLIIRSILGDSASKAEEEEAKAEEAKRKTPSVNKMVNLHKAILMKKHLVDQQRQKQQDLQQQQHQLQQQQGGKASQKKRARLEMDRSNDLLDESAVVKPPEQIPIEDLAFSPLLELELRRHPGETRVDRLKRSFLTIRADAKVSVLKKFLTKKLECSSGGREFEITSTLDDESVILDDEMALMHAQEALCSDDDEKLVLKYKVLEG